MRLSLRLLAAVLLLASCKESPVDPVPTETSFTFEYRLGTEAWQSFAAEGQQPSGTSFSARGAWVFTGSSGPPHGTLIVQPHQQVSGNWVTFLVYVPNIAGIDSVAVGQVGQGACAAAVSKPCTQAFLRVESATTGALLEWCNILDGEMVVTRIPDQWVSGRLSGTGTCTATTGGATRAFAVQNAEFDVALPPPAAGPG
jgi:hypothetical protein